MTIKGLYNPICKTCVHFRPNLSDFQYASPYSKCAKFGKKHIVSGKMMYEYADMSRDDETKCGQDAREYKKDPFVNLKIAKYYGILASPLALPLWILLNV